MSYISEEHVIDVEVYSQHGDTKILREPNTVPTQDMMAQDRNIFWISRPLRGESRVTGGFPLHKGPVIQNF